VSKQFKTVLFIIFLLSGASGLIYQTVWIRLAFASFGIILPVLSVTISVFMAGLALGSWLGGKYIDAFSKKLKISSALFYCAAEVIIACGALIVPKLFGLGQYLLLNVGTSDSGLYLLLSALMLSACLLPWCFSMGVTFPFMMSFIKQTDEAQNSSFSFLYTANVIGAVIGVLGAAILWIEILGFSGTLLIAATFNLAAALLAFTLYAQNKNKRVVNTDKHESFEPLAAKITLPFSEKLVVLVLFVTGFSSLSMEVAWTRAYSPVLGTMIYAFAFLLAGYLFASWLGTRLYRRDIMKGKIKSRPVLIMLLSLFSFLPVLINDPQIFVHGTAYTVLSYNIYVYLFQVLVSIFPLCFVLGYITPSLIDSYSQGDPKRAGKIYAVNTLGCILGPIVTSYLLLPLLGVKSVLIFFALSYTVLFFLCINKIKPAVRNTAIVITALFTAVSIFWSSSYEVPKFEKAVVKRDYAATVVATANDKDGLNLLVNGYGITSKTTITKVMAHLPLAYHKGNPESALVICFGMGTTYRSLLSWDINVTAVELAPGVVSVFPIFYEDAQKVLDNPKGKIIIDDGRRFLMRTPEKFDVITLDPPPPLQSAGSSLLYSREFYKLAKLRLKENGILQQWIPGNDIYYIACMTKALKEEFTYVKAFISMEGFGIHLIASMSPLDELTPEDIVARLPQKASDDLIEWLPKQFDAKIIFHLMKEVSVEYIIAKGEIIYGKNFVLTDNTPYNEYYLLLK